MSTSSPSDNPYRQFRFTRPAGACELLIIRHGESAPADPEKPFDLVDGHGDPELAPEGRDQAERLAERLADEEIDAMYVTKLRRTHETAAPLAARKGLTPSVDPDLHEVFLGEWEGGLVRIKAVERDPQYIEMHRKKRWDAIPGAEPQEDFHSRVWTGFDRISARHPDQLVAVVVHGGVIGAFLGQITGAGAFAFTGADNASISHVVRVPADDLFDERWVLRRYNDTTHLRTHFSTAAESPT